MIHALCKWTNLLFILIYLPLYSFISFTCLFFTVLLKLTEMLDFQSLCFMLSSISINISYSKPIWFFRQVMWLSCIPSLNRSACQKDQNQVSCWSCRMSWAGVSYLHWLGGGEKRGQRCCLITAKYQPEDLQQPGSRISEILCGAHLSRAPAASKC